MKRGVVLSEHSEQVQLMTWCKVHAWKIPELRWITAIPNGGLRNKIVAAKLKQEGVQPGIPDLFLPAPRSPYVGLWIELKRRKGGQVTEHQKRWIDYLRTVPYRVEVCRGWEAARDVLLDYLGHRE